MKILKINIKTVEERRAELKMRETELAIIVEAIERLMDKFPLHQKSGRQAFDTSSIVDAMTRVVYDMAEENENLRNVAPTFCTNDTVLDYVTMCSRLYNRFSDVQDLYDKKGFTLNLYFDSYTHQRMGIEIKADGW